MEHLICLTKELLKHLGPNLTEAAAKRCSKAVGHMSYLTDLVDEDLIIIIIIMYTYIALFS